MSYWQFTDEKLKVGDIYIGYMVEEIGYKVPLSVKINNYFAINNERWQDVLTEMPQQCVRLSKLPYQLSLPGVE